jgi:hypothetical protein
VKVVQELLRHSTARMTLDTYTQALSPHKRAAQSKVVNMIRPKGTCTVDVPRASQEIRANDSTLTFAGKGIPTRTVASVSIRLT